MGVDLRGKRAGVVGLGNIGVAVARRVLAFGMEVVYWSRGRKPEVEFAMGVIHRPRRPAVYQRLCRCCSGFDAGNGAVL
jgi:lactate dehydrogenase-like 2-hydroxyacid dehydrogenase